MKKQLRIVVILISLLPLHSAAQYGGMDMEVAQKWAAAKVVKYRVEGLHKARAGVVFGDHEGKADVIDRMTVEFSWDMRKRKIIGPVTVKDAKSEISNIKSDGTNCPPPQLKGEYEHFQVVSNSMTSGDQIQIKGIRTFPPASVSQYPASCSQVPIKGGKEEVLQYVGGADPQGLAMPIVKGGPVAIAADRKSFSIKGAENWVWTYTPTLVQ